MGLEVSDARLLKEPHGIITYANDTLQDAVKFHEHSQTCVNPCTDQDNCEVKECVEKHSFDMSEACGEKKADDVLQEDKLNSRSNTGNKLKNLIKHVSRASDGSPRLNCTIPQPFALATERRASYGARTLSYEADGCAAAAANKLSVKLKETQSPSSAKRNQLLSLFLSRKPTQAENKKHCHDDDVDVDDDGVTSLATTKPKITVASAPMFRSTERAEKRKEFNSKLEEKHQALEAEKLESEARTKEEREAAIKQLRKSLIFKASPMPNFYQSPPKLQVKKPAQTCAKSPKFGRRRSCSDADGLNNLRKDSQRGSCHSNITKTTLTQNGNRTFNCSEDRRGLSIQIS